MSVDADISMREGRLVLEPAGDGALTLRFLGALDNTTVPFLWGEVERLGAETSGRRWVVDAGGITKMDGSGMALLLRVRCLGAGKGREVELRGISPGYRRLLERFDPAAYRTIERQDPCCQSLPEQVGRTVLQMWADFRIQVSFIGELAAAFGRAAMKPETVRWRDLWLAAERAGADALPIVALISGLVGLVLAFQAGMAMRPYGAEIYVANLVTIAMLRELGPLMTAILLSGRSGGAFAAEIGTMKVNEEVAALATMGLSPVAFLAVPRVVGLVLMVPLLTLFANVAGIAGGALMFLTLDYPFSTYFDQVLASAEIRHLMSGLVKSVAFAWTIAGVGCLRGLQTQRGPSAVGQSTTSAVVTSILLIVILDAILGTVFYFLQF
ncbi:MAG: ABC transporter permease [Verrucomicrobiales bacterium]|nr:ABC transporter permease [Verrucomicrobiales bacterium]